MEYRTGDVLELYIVHLYTQLVYLAINLEALRPRSC